MRVKLRTSIALKQALPVWAFIDFAQSTVHLPARAGFKSGPDEPLLLAFHYGLAHQRSGFACPAEPWKNFPSALNLSTSSMGTGSSALGQPNRDLNPMSQSILFFMIQAPVCFEESIVLYERSMRPCHPRHPGENFANSGIESGRR